MILTYHFDNKLKDELEEFKKYAVSKGILVVKTRQDLIEDEVYSRFDLSLLDKEILNLADYAAVLVLDFIELAVKVGSAYTLFKFLFDKIRAKKPKGQLLLIHPIYKGNAQVNLCFNINENNLSAITKITNVINKVAGGVDEYKNRAMVFDYNKDIDNWDIKNPKILKIKLGNTLLTNQRLHKANGFCSKKFFDSLSPEEIKQIEEGNIPTKVYKHSLCIRPYYRRLYNAEEISEALKFSPISITIKIFESFVHSEDGKIELPEKNEKFIDNHCVTIIGVDENQKRLDFDNRYWGLQWGDKGLGSLPFRYLDDNLIEAWVSETLFSFTPLYLKNFLRKEFWLHHFLKKEKGKKYAEIIKGKLVKKGVFRDKRNNNVTYEFYNVISLLSNRGYCFVVNIYDNKIKNKYGGWAHFSAKPKEGFIEIEELFIDEKNRDCGWGTKLLDIIKDFAKKQKVIKIKGWFSVQDAYNEVAEHHLKHFFRENGFNCIPDKTRFIGCLYRFEKDIIMSLSE